MYIYISIIFIICMYIVLFLYRHKKFIHIRTKIYISINDYINYITQNIDSIDSNFEINFNNCIYKFLMHNRKHHCIKEFNKSNFSYDDVIKYKYNNTNFINTSGYYDQNIFWKEYINLDIKTNNIDSIDKEKVYYIYDDKKFTIKIDNLHDVVDDFIDDNYDLYKKFIQKFNDIDTHIIKICAYGPSGTGKTHFLKNINKLFTNIENYKSYIYFKNIDRIKLKNFNNIRSNAYFKKYLLETYEYPITEIYMNLDNTKMSDKCIDYIFECYNNTIFLNNTIIILCESENYIKYYDTFDVIFEGKYLIDDDIKKINNNINIKMNEKSTYSIPVNNITEKTKVTINDIVSFHLNK